MGEGPDRDTVRGTSGEGTIEMLQLQRNRKVPVQGLPEVGVQVPRQRYLQRRDEVLRESLRCVLLKTAKAGLAEGEGDAQGSLHSILE